MTVCTNISMGPGAIRMFPIGQNPDKETDIVVELSQLSILRSG